MGAKLILNSDEINRMTIDDAEERFLRDCKLRNLSPHTFVYDSDKDYYITNIYCVYLNAGDRNFGHRHLLLSFFFHSFKSLACL